MQFGKTFKQREEARMAKYQETSKWRNSWVSTYAWLPKQMIDGTWVWLDHLEYTDWNRTIIPGNAPQYYIGKKRRGVIVAYRLDETHRPSIFSRFWKKSEA